VQFLFYAAAASVDAFLQKKNLLNIQLLIFSLAFVIVAIIAIVGTDCRLKTFFSSSFRLFILFFSLSSDYRHSRQHFHVAIALFDIVRLFLSIPANFCNLICGRSSDASFANKKKYNKY
jgi:hypothetical protein